MLYSIPEMKKIRDYGALVETLAETAAPEGLVKELSRVVKELKRLAK